MNVRNKIIEMFFFTFQTTTVSVWREVPSPHHVVILLPLFQLTVVQHILLLLLIVLVYRPFCTLVPKMVFGNIHDWVIDRTSLLM